MSVEDLTESEEAEAALAGAVAHMENVAAYLESIGKPDAVERVRLIIVRIAETAPALAEHQNNLAG